MIDSHGWPLQEVEAEAELCDRDPMINRRRRQTFVDRPKRPITKAELLENARRAANR